jgi:hypothetical protein
MGSDSGSGSEEAPLEQTAFETADAGASHTFPCTASAVRKGGFMVIKGRPCKVVDVSTSKTGKHGHAKCHFVALDIFTSRKMEELVPSSHNLEARGYAVSLRRGGGWAAHAAAPRVAGAFGAPQPRRGALAELGQTARQPAPPAPHRPRTPRAALTTGAPHRCRTCPARTTACWTSPTTAS